jgi:AcrR family transcriptional regulator
MPNRPLLKPREIVSPLPLPLRVTRRALQADAKEQRRTRILDAAERVLLAAPNRDIGMADVAQAAELAKGTVYLYFAGKEELLLALHERQIEGFFSGLSEAASLGRLDFEAVFRLIDAHALSPPLYLPLASRCLGSLDFSVAPAVRAAYKARIAGHLDRVGRLLEQHFSGLEVGGGVSLLFSSYALIMGLWQLLSPDPDHPYPVDFRRDAELALRALWRGRMIASPG